MLKVLVTGANGQLGTCIKDIATSFKEIRFIYKDLPELNITNKKDVIDYFKDESISYCINCAAYTAVDKAESDIKTATKVNVIGAKILAEACYEFNVVLIHVSTDFVFSGNNTISYNEEDKTDPINVYGKTKLEGEQEIQAILKKYIIIRTSWLYSEYGNNFLKTMFKLGMEKSSIQVVSDQMGSPTYGKDLALAIIKFIEKGSSEFGVYHFSNKGEISWYEFAKAIIEGTKSNANIIPITSLEYVTLAKRPKFSALNTSKIERVLNIKIPKWEESLKTAISNL